MPARVVVALDDRALADNVGALLRTAGEDVMVFTDSMVALHALERAETIRVLVTSVDFLPGQPNGVSLSLMARTRRLGIQTIFVGPPGIERHTTGLGELLVQPTGAGEIAGAVKRLLDAAQQNSN